MPKVPKLPCYVCLAEMELALSDLPDELLAGILAKVPFSKSKVAAQSVCKLWQNVLQTSAAHSVDTLEEDSSVEFVKDPTLVVQRDGFATQRLASQLAASLACLKLKEENNMPWFDASSFAFTEYPEWLPQMKQILQVIDLSAYSLAEYDAIVLFHELESLVNLRFVKVKINGVNVVDFNGPKDCKVSYEINFFYENSEDPYSTLLEVPDGMAKHLQTLRLYDPWIMQEEVDNPVEHVDLGSLANCAVLERIDIDLWSSDEKKSHFYGLGNLAPSVQSISVNLSSIDEQHDHMWQLAPGWQMTDLASNETNYLIISRIKAASA